MDELAVIIIITMMFLTLGCVSSDRPFINSSIDETKNYSIVFPLRSMSFSGPFTIGIGNVGSKIYYYMFIIQPDGSSKLQALNAGSVGVFEVDDGRPRLECAPPLIYGECKIYIPKDNIKKVYSTG